MRRLPLLLVILLPAATPAGAAFSDRLQLWVERIAGEENASALTLACQLTERWGLSLAWQHPNGGEGDDSYSLHAGCALPCHSAGE